MKNILFILTTFLLFSFSAAAQNDERDMPIVVKDSTLLKPYTIDALAPARAAFYSAIVPGLGQVYNKKYWKLPIVYGGMGTSIYFYTWNDKLYREYRNAYKDVLAGKPLTGKLANLDADRLIRAQKFQRRNRDLSMFVTIGIYILNIVDANVDAHLKQFNVNENLTLVPSVQQNQLDYKYNMGLTLSYQF